MKTLTLFLILITTTVFADPVNPKDLTIIIFDNQQAIQLTIQDDMTIQEGFAFLHQITNVTQNRMVIKDGQRYFRYGFTLLPKNRVYLLTKKKFLTKRKLIKL